jgi:hypothetical protein
MTIQIIKGGTMKLREIFLLLVFLLLLFLTGSCKENPTDPPPEKEDIVPQSNITWLSLADTPWPMYHHDPQSTGRSEYIGPQSGNITHIQFDDFETMSGISIGYDKTAFLPSGDFAYRFVAFDYSGNIKWSNNLRSTSTPIISSDSSIYIATVDKTLLSLKTNGDTLWTTPIDKMYNIGCNIDKNGNIYFIDFKGNYPNSIAELKVANKYGEILWTLKDSKFLPTPDSQPTFSPDGNTLYVQGKEVSVLAIDINSQTIKWTFGDKEQLSSPVIDNDGNLYIIPGEQWFSNNRKFYSLDSEGKVNWEFDFGANTFWDNTEPTIDYNGNIYFGADTLYSLSNSGKLRWKKELGGVIISPLVCDKNNVVYIGTENRTTGEGIMYSFESNGELKWEIDNLGFRTLGGCPAITDEGSLLFPSWKNYQISLSIIK